MATAPVCRHDVIVDESVEVIVDGRLEVFADENAEPVSRVKCAPGGVV